MVVRLGCELNRGQCGGGGGLTSEAPCREPLSEGHRHPSYTSRQTKQKEERIRLRFKKFPDGLKVVIHLCEVYVGALV